MDTQLQLAIRKFQADPTNSEAAFKIASIVSRMEDVYPIERYVFLEFVHLSDFYFFQEGVMPALSIIGFYSDFIDLQIEAQELLSRRLPEILGEHYYSEVQDAINDFATMTEHEVEGEDPLHVINYYLGNISQVVSAQMQNQDKGHLYFLRCIKINDADFLGLST